eukprot:6173519-Pleurochrysis_carterae.AAC.3
MGMCVRTALTQAEREVCVIITPLGSPVEPDVYMSTAMDSGFGGVGASGFALPMAITSSKESNCNAGGALSSRLRIEPFGLGSGGSGFDTSSGVQSTSVYTTALSDGVLAVMSTTCGSILRLHTSTVTPPCTIAFCTELTPSVA